MEKLQFRMILFRLHAVARMSNQSTWVLKGLLDPKFTFTPGQLRIALNNNFWTVEDRCEELFGWRKCQKEVETQLIGTPEGLPNEES